MLVRVSAFLSLALGVYGFLAALTGWGAVVGAVAGAMALLFGWAALTEDAVGRTRWSARVGVVAGGLAIVVLFVWVVLVIFEG